MDQETSNPPISRDQIRPLSDWLRREAFMGFRSLGPSILETEAGRERVRQIMAMNMVADLLENHLEQHNGVNSA